MNKPPPNNPSTLPAGSVPTTPSQTLENAAAATSVVPCQQVIAAESFREYTRFRQNILTQLSQRPPEAEAEGRSGLNMEEVPLQERRKKNNEAAKRSRDTRRAKEDEIAIRAAFLEQENLQLKWEAARLRTEIGRLRASLLLMTSLTDTTTK